MSRNGETRLCPIGAGSAGACAVAVAGTCEGPFDTRSKGPIMARQLMIPAADTQLYTVDTPGGSPPLLFLSGGFGTVRNWNPVIQRLAGKHRAVRFDARARGKSGAVSRLLGAGSRRRRRTRHRRDRHRTPDPGRLVLRRHDRGALRGASRRTGRGLVLVDGAYPIAMFDEAGKEKVHAQFRRLGWIMRILAVLGRSARMSPAESAAVVIEMDAVNGELGPDFAALECPAVFVVGTGGHSGATEEEMRTVRAAVAEPRRATRACPCSRRRPTSTRRSSAKAPDTVVAAIEDVIQRSS